MAPPSRIWAFRPRIPFPGGVFRKYEKKDAEWFDLFKEKIRYDSVYLPEK